MSVGDVMWLVLCGAWLVWVLWASIHKWRSSAVNPSRAVLPEWFGIFVFYVLFSFAFIPFDWSHDKSNGALVRVSPGFGVTERGDIAEFSGNEGIEFYAHIVGFPDDRVVLEGDGAMVDGEPLTALGWTPTTALHGCREEVVRPDRIAVIQVTDRGSCESIIQVSIDRYLGRIAFVIWPPWSIGRPEWEQTWSRGGLGMKVGMRDNEVTVISVLDGNAAAAAGLEAGDRIVQIDEELTDSMTLDEAVKMMRGPVGSKVTLYVRREGVAKILEFPIERALIELDRESAPNDR